MRSARRKGRPFGAELLRSVLLGLATTLVLLPARRSMKVMLEGKLEGEKLAPSR